MRLPFEIIRSSIVWVLGFFWVWVAYVVALWQSRRIPKAVAFRRCAVLWARLLLRTGGVRVRVEGEEHVRKAMECGRGVVVASNHCSIFDIPLLLVAVPFECAFMSKASIFSVPVVGWYMQNANYLSVKRDDMRKAVAVLDQARERLAEGVSIFVYPEGTRSVDGKLQRFRRGAVTLAIRMGAPILPVGMTGTHDILAKNSFLIHPGEVVVRFGPVMQTSSFDGDDRTHTFQATEALRERIAALVPISHGGERQDTCEIATRSGECYDSGKAPALAPDKAESSS